jgi:hypothetical protein
LTLTLNSFQNSTTKAFSTLVEFVSTQTRDFRERLDSGIKAFDGKVVGIADKLNADIAKLGDEAAQNRDAVRQAIELKLDASAAKAADDAKELQGGLSGSLHRLGGNALARYGKFSEPLQSEFKKYNMVVERLGRHATYYNESRIHRSLDKDAPFHRAIERFGVITSQPVLGGLHHQYCRI